MTYCLPSQQVYLEKSTQTSSHRVQLHRYLVNLLERHMQVYSTAELLLQQHFHCMNNNAHYRITNTLCTPQLKDHLTETIHREIVELVFQYYKSTVTDIGKLNIPIIQCLETFLCSAYTILCL